MPYSAPLDGLRALAILAVLLFHIAPDALPGGFTGVDVFFVLSGYLIASIIRHDVAAGVFTLREFYLRRLQRLLPNVVVTVVAVVALWTWLLPPSAGRQAAAHGLWALVSLSNVYVLTNLGDYWGNAAESAPLTHTWSLGVEEQFYLLFPALFAVALRRTRHPVRWTALVALASGAWCLLFGPAHPAGTFYLLPSRIWELLAGVLVSLAAPRLAAALDARAWLRETLGLAGVALIGIGVAVVRAEETFPGLPALWPAGGTVLLLASIAGGASQVARELSRAPLVATGRVSYSLYLWHWPLIILGRQYAAFWGWPALAGAALGAAASILVSVAVYFAVERPLRARGAGRRWRVATIVVALVAALGFTRGVSRRPFVADPTGRFDPLVFSGLRYDADYTPGSDHKAVARYYDVTFRTPDLVAPAAWRTGGIIRRYGGGAPEVVMLGSSHALMYSLVLDDVCRDARMSVAFLGADGRSALFENAADFDDARRRWLATWRPRVVIVADRWDLRWTNDGDVAARLDRLLATLAPMTTRVALLTQPPVLPTGEDANLREFVVWRAGATGPLPALWPNEAEGWRRRFADAMRLAASRWPNVEVVDVAAPFYESDGRVRYADGRRFLYADDDHLTDEGASEVRKLIETIVDR